MSTAAKQAKPFLKWAGGKGQLIEQLTKHLPLDLKAGKIRKYFEPFLGGGALFFWLSQRYNFECVHLNEINPVVTNCYKVIQGKVNKLVENLHQLEMEYLAASEAGREAFYYKRREEFNKLIFSKAANSNVRKAALLIFLNKTCFNGLFRVNSLGEFNVPFGRYKNPTICDEDNLRAASKCLQRAKITCADFSKCLDNADSESFVYFDPPYRPISATSNFTGYSKYAFNESEQRRLHDIFVELAEHGAYVMLSNSDPKNIDPVDNFFDDLYKDFTIKRLNATRLINCNANRRGTVSEILITNY